MESDPKKATHVIAEDGFSPELADMIEKGAEPLNEGFVPESVGMEDPDLGQAETNTLKNLGCTGW